MDFISTIKSFFIKNAVRTTIEDPGGNRRKRFLRCKILWNRTPFGTLTVLFSFAMILKLSLALEIGSINKMFAEITDRSTVRIFILSNWPLIGWFLNWRETQWPLMIHSKLYTRLAMQLNENSVQSTEILNIMLDKQNWMFKMDQNLHIIRRRVHRRALLISTFWRFMLAYLFTNNVYSLSYRMYSIFNLPIQASNLLENSRPFLRFCLFNNVRYIMCHQKLMRCWFKTLS